MLNILKKFRSSEDGAVTVDWVVLLLWLGWPQLRLSKFSQVRQM